MDLQDILPSDTRADTDRWNREWMHYFTFEGQSTTYACFLSHEKLSVAEDLRGMSPAQVFAAGLVEEVGQQKIGPPLRVWIEGDAIVGKRIVEIGCGCGWLGKRLGLVSEFYFGLDYSDLAIAIARGVSPPNCKYAHLSDKATIETIAGTMDTLIGRHFFIHQNYENARWVLQLGTYLLKPGGKISADFYLINRAVEQGVLHPAKSPLDRQHASCAFVFEPGEFDELAEACGLELQSISDRLDVQRRFVLFRKR